MAAVSAKETIKIMAFGGALHSNATFYSNDKGAVLIWFTILLAVLIGMLSFSIDLGMMVSSQAQYQKFVEQAALRSLQSYFETAGDENEKDLAALTSTQDLLRENLSNLIARNYFTHSAQFVDPSELLLSNQRSNTISTLTPGRWWPQDPGFCDSSSDPEDVPCPCSFINGARRFTGACFQTLKVDDFPYRTKAANAYRVHFLVQHRSPLRSIFANFLGISSYRVQSEAIAASTPRQPVFIVDVSASTQRDTHLRDATSSFQTEFAYKLTDDCPPAPACQTSGACKFEDLESSPHDRLYNGHQGNIFLPDTTPPSGRSSVTEHFKSDYSCFNVDFNNLVPRSSGGMEVQLQQEHYMVDRLPVQSGNSFQLVNGTPYYGPEPLSSIMRSIFYALQRMQQTAVAGDGTASLFFDHALVRERMFFAGIDPSNLTNLKLLKPSDSQFTSLLGLLDIEHQTSSGYDERVRQTLFPRYEARTNFPQALILALKALQNESLGQRYPSVIMFTDGRSNCFCADGSADCDSGMGSYNCGADNNSFNLSLFNSKRIIGASTPQFNLPNSFIENRIPLHMVMFGKKSGTHHLLYKSNNNPSRCMEQTEAKDFYLNTRQDLYPWVDPGDDNPPNFRSPISFAPNLYYNLVRETDGLWLPLLPPCPAFNQPSTGFSDGQEYLNYVCSQLPRGQRLNPGLAPAELMNWLGTELDDQGRLFCDPRGLSYAQQLREFVDTIMGENPYRLVTEQNP